LLGSPDAERRATKGAPLHDSPPREVTNLAYFDQSGFYKAREQKVHGRNDDLGQPFRLLFPIVKTLTLLLCTVAALPAAELGDPKKLPAAAAGFDFDRDVREVLETSCVHCHNAEKDKGGLRLDTRDLALKGGDEHKAIVPGNRRKARCCILRRGSWTRWRCLRRAKANR
jgi:hypothetical protein